MEEDVNPNIVPFSYYEVKEMSGVNAKVFDEFQEKGAAVMFNEDKPQIFKDAHYDNVFYETKNISAPSILIGKLVLKEEAHRVPGTQKQLPAQNWASPTFPSGAKKRQRHLGLFHCRSYEVNGDLEFHDSTWLQKRRNIQYQEKKGVISIMLGKNSSQRRSNKRVVYQGQPYCIGKKARIWKIIDPMYHDFGKTFNSKDEEKMWRKAMLIASDRNDSGLVAGPSQPPVAGNEVSDLGSGASYMQKVATCQDQAHVQFLYWSQRMKEGWVAKGDCPSKILYSRVKKRRCGLTNMTGELKQGQEEIESIVVSNLKEVFLSDNLPLPSQDIDQVLREIDLPQLSYAESTNLVRPFTSQEIRAAMFTMPTDKSSGPDGVSVEFFKHNWERVGSSVVDIIQHFISTGFMLKEWNRTLLVMIPKISSPEEFSHLRPISLCNTIHKCASKCLANRLKMVLPSFIQDEQHAFIPGRYMSDNILLSHELLSFINSRTRTGLNLVVVKIDMSKAYDRVHWGFLLKVLQAYGFPPHWLHLIQQCISTTSFKVLLNRKTTSSFRPNCGLRQGDPLSPYLFLFCMDILGRMLTLGRDIKQFQGITPVRRGPCLSHLFFADDAMIFFKATTEGCVNIKGIMSRFCAISGQQLNLQKSYIKFIPNTTIENQQSLRDILRMQQVTQFQVHLGVPIDIVGKKSTRFHFLIDKVAALLISWNMISLSQQQKLILINSVVISTIPHILNCLEIPIVIANKIDSMVAAFFWEKQGTKGMHWPGEFIITPNYYCPKVYHAKGRSSLSTGAQSSVRGHISWGFREIRKAENLLLRGCCWKTGTGTKVVAGRDKWVDGRVRVFSSDVHLDEARSWKVCDFILQGPMRWNAEKLRHSFEWKDGQDILSMELPDEDDDDHLQWSGQKSGQFTVKSGYAFICGLEDVELPRDTSDLAKEFFKTLWSLNIPPKWKLFL
ncbi:uncharacterized protein [Spinacia oleracea]|uniref:Reverse transcriptase domain-containing protein n=1 Tax=Spinacia oleracea TaxID=3562 RepID=A0ABM3QVA8_SPIOL|nr:uncharacterized protein LOC130462632 [Spinacia oleracea]